MELINFDGYPQNLKLYGGKAGQKIGISYMGEDYIIKFPRNLRDANFKNVVLSYSNSPVCEYIGSHVYDILGYDVHETLLGTRNGKVVVACKDFRNPGDELSEFEKILVTNETPSLSSTGTSSPHGQNGEIDLEEVLATIREHPILKEIPGVSEHFWDMFVVDAFIGNPDRNNGNWGIIVQQDGHVRLAPVYDNGNCLNDKWEEARMRRTLNDPKSMDAMSYKGKVCVFSLNGKRINPYQLIAGMQYPECNNAVIKNTWLIYDHLQDIRQMVNDIPCLSRIQKDFYIGMMESRYDNVLLETFRKLEHNDAGESGTSREERIIREEKVDRRESLSRSGLERDEEEWERQGENHVY